MVASISTQTPVRFGTFELDLRSGELRKSGLRIKLQQQPLQVLKLLVERPGEIITREELRQELWPRNTYVDFDRGLNKAVVRLREALGDSAESPRFIETLPRRGYRLIVPLREDVPASRVQQPSAVSSRQSSIAVLPFHFLNSGEEGGPLSLGFADALITTLANLENLIVLPTATILRYAGSSDPAQTGRELGVHYVLQGNIQQLGPQWRVSIQVFDAEVKKIAFSEKYDFRLENIFEVQDQMGARVAEVLKLRFRSAAPRSRDRYSADPSAYSELMQGLRHSSSDDPTTRDQAIEQLTAALARDPDLALAHAVLSYVCAVKHFESDSSPVCWKRPSTIASGPWNSIQTSRKDIWREPTFSGARRGTLPTLRPSPNCNVRWRCTRTCSTRTTGWEQSAATSDAWRKRRSSMSEGGVCSRIIRQVTRSRTLTFSAANTRRPFARSICGCAKVPDTSTRFTIGPYAPCSAATSYPRPRG